MRSSVVSSYQVKKNQPPNRVHYYYYLLGHHGFKISSLDGLNFIFGEVCGSAIRDQEDGNLFLNEDGEVEWNDIREEMGRVGKLVHLVGCGSNEDLDNDFMVNSYHLKLNLHLLKIIILSVIECFKKTFS